MTEQLQTRTEHSHSVSDAEKYQAIHTLTELGLLIPVSQLETYHGRVGQVTEDEPWTVDPGFVAPVKDVSSVNRRLTLYTSDAEVAADFADTRAFDMANSRYKKVFEARVADYTPQERQEWLNRENDSLQKWWDGLDAKQRTNYPNFKPLTFDDLKPWREAIELGDRVPKSEQDEVWSAAIDGLRAELHEITTADSDATVLDFEFDATQLDPQSTERYTLALSVLADQTPLTDGSPVSFYDREDVATLMNIIDGHQREVIFEPEIAVMAEQAGVSQELAMQLASAYNARHIAAIKPTYLASVFVYRVAEIFIDTLRVDGVKQPIPLNLEYAQRYFRNAHIVGVSQPVNTATLGDRQIVATSFLDLEKTKTTKSLERERAAIWGRLGGLVTSLGEAVRTLPSKELPPLLQLLTDVHAKPEQLVAAAKQVAGYQEIFDASAGNWEGFTLAEHTETVLRNFDENYADSIPVELIAPMRLAILAHDAGKPIAAAAGEKYRQQDYNVAQADDFFTKLGIDARLKDLLVSVIGDGEALAFQIDIRKQGEPAEAALKALAVRELQKFTGQEQVSDAQVTSYTELCRMLQICDGGAYTSMAVTRDAESGLFYRNAPSFNDSFTQPGGFGKRAIRVRGVATDPAANAELAPRDVQDASRLHIVSKGAGRRPPEL